MWESEQNRNSLSPAGLKEAQGFATRIDTSWSTHMPPGILGAPLNPDPHIGGDRAPAGNTFSAARPANDMPPGLLPANGALNSDPHPYGGDRKEPNTYGRVPNR
jgi:hypothetical protein